MPISFPSNPSSGDTYDFGGIHYIYNGDGWVNKSIYGISAGSGISFANYNGTGPVVISVVGGSVGATGATGADGATGAGGALGYWGSFWSTQDQQAAGTTGAYPITYNNTDPNSNGVSIVSNSQITFSYPGVYNIEFSAQADRVSGSGTDTIDIWFRKNGTDIADSNTIVTVSGSAAAAKTVAAWNYMLQVNANDYVELMWRTSDTRLEFIADPAGTNPTRPAIPSVILSAHQVMYTQLGPTGPTGPMPTDYVSSFNGKTGAVQGVSSINGNTGAISNVAFTNTAQSFTGLQQFTQGISGSGGVTFYFPSSGNTSIRFVSTAARYIEITPGLQNSMVGYGSGGFKFKSNSGQLSLASVNVTAIGDVDGDNQQTVLYVDDDSGIISFSFVGGQYTFPNTDGSANDVLTTDGAGQISWVGNVAKTNIAQSFTGLQQFPGGISASGATFSSNVNINAKTILGSTVLGSATPGCIEFDGNNLYAGTTGGRGLIEAPHISYASSLVSLSGITAYQNIFSASSDVITLAANTSYIVEGHIVVQSGTTTHTTALRLTDSVVANSPIFRLHILSTAVAAGTISRAQDTVYFETNGGVINSTSATARCFILLRGAIETVDSVTITPQVAFSANPGGTNQIQDGSWIKFTPVGTNTVTSIGPWA